MNNIKNSGLYDPSYEHDACGIGAIVSIDGIKSHKIVEDALDILIHLEHRGGTGAESNSGDGAGILVQLPHDYFKELDLGFKIADEGSYAVAQIFTSKNEEIMKKSLELFRSSLDEHKLHLLGFRKVPFNASELGMQAKGSLPGIYQAFIEKPSNESSLEFERHLYLARRVIEKNALKLNLSDFYICSMSSKTIVYKGMLVSTQVQSFYVDLTDIRFKSAIATVHSRFSTNTFPSWSKAHPYRMICHNGEINTIKGNVNGVMAREGLFKSNIYKEHLAELLPVIANPSSDSAMVDNFIEFLVMNGRSIEEAIMLLIPEPWTKDSKMDAKLRAYYEFNSTFMEPWDGPSAIIFTDGTKLGATLDRNGLRPARYCLKKDNTLVIYSETGSLNIDEKDIIYKKRLEPGKMLLIDTNEKRIIPNEEIKLKYATEYPYTEYVKNIIKLPSHSFEMTPNLDDERFNDLCSFFKYSNDDINNSIIYQVNNQNDKTVAMGYDRPLPVLRRNVGLLFDYFMQNFAQVTNPPIDSIRENNVTSQRIYVGREENLIHPTASNAKRIKLKTPIISLDELNQIKSLNQIITSEVFITYDPKQQNLASAIENICMNVADLINNGSSIIILSDRMASNKNVAIPSMLICSAVHTYLTNKSLRTHASLILDSYEPREIHHFACLVGYGVTAVCPRLVYDIINRKIKAGVIKKSYDEAVRNYISANTKGITKIMSKMGISTIQSYNGAQIFEALGLSYELVSKYFPGTRSAVSGIGLKEIEEDLLKRHNNIKDNDDKEILLDKKAIELLQDSTQKGDYEEFKEYSSYVNSKIFNLHNLFKLKTKNSISIDEIEPASEIVKRFSTGAMSFGAISKEAHETIARAMNKIHGMSNCGEGGEDISRYESDSNSQIKQIASGRFGVTIEYLNSAKEIQIKVAQGAKPGEGGNLPKNKVYPWIAKARNSTPGVQLISPPPHHDIYSIEDLAQLIYDLRSANPNAKISIKLVSEAGVGTVASGVVKAGANKILISGFNGGTGAAPRTSVSHAGMPFEIGLSEAHQTLILNNLRSRVKLETDGKLLTGFDVIVSAILGADLFSFSSAPLITIGCRMLKVCNLNTCPFGVATQSEKLRSNFKGKEDNVVNFMYFIAQEVREYLALLGYRSLNEVIGHVELIHPMPINGLDFSNLLFNPEVQNKTAAHFEKYKDVNLLNTIDPKRILPLCEDNLRHCKNSTVDLQVENTNRAIGTYLSGYVVRNKISLDHNEVEINCYGNAGNSLGAFLTKGISINVIGDANDYVGKGLSGGIISIRPSKDFIGKEEENIISGNVCLYGATSGEAYFAGECGERFGVRLSGAKAIAISVGNHGCEYMTGGEVIILDRIGHNFASGMSGGVCYIKRSKENLENINPDLISIYDLKEDDFSYLKKRINRFIDMTNSNYAKNLLNNIKISDYVKIIPNDYKHMLDLLDKYKNDDNAQMKAFEEAIS